MSYPGPPPPPPHQGGWGAPPPPPPGGPYGGPPDPPASAGGAIGALVANALALCLCWALALPGVILAIVAVTQVNDNPKAARVCTLIAWILFGVAAAVGVLYLLLWGGTFMSTLVDGL
ncbi:hypothetical protein [Marinactinospora rubrisoli]|uniref:DUF4190 domain-containing protein n=1 Tax=Marinactinospora rubrisoli TaxID=2715399 RepID=A0ABW2KHK8_9ACTN